MSRSKIRFLTPIRAFLMLLFVLSVNTVTAQTFGDNSETNVQTELDELMITLWSPNGEMIATGSLNGRLQIWNKNGTPVFDEMRDGAVSSLTWSADSTRLALGGIRNKAEIVNVTLPGYAIGEKLGEIQQEGMYLIRWSPNSAYIATSDSRTHNAQIWNVGSPTRYVFNSEQGIGAQRAMEWSPDGYQLAVANEGQIQFIDVRDFSGKFVAQTIYAQELAWSPDGRYLAANLYNYHDPTQSKITIYDTRENPVIIARTLTGTAALQSFAMAWSPDGTRIASFVKDGSAYKVIVFDALNGMVLATYTTNKTVQATGLSWNADGQLAYPTFVSGIPFPAIVTPPTVEHD